MQMKMGTQSDRDIIHDKVVAAMETGNHAKAREVLAEHADSFPMVVELVRREVQADYGIRL